MCKTASSSNSNWRQLNLAGNIADGIDVVNGRVLVLVNNDVSLCVQLHAGLLQTNALRLGHSADSPNQVINVVDGALVALSIAVGDRELAVGVLLDLGRLRLSVDVYSQSVILVGGRLLDHGVEGSQKGLASDEKMCFCTEGIEHASKFNGNVASADNSHLLGLFLNLKETVAVGAQLGSGDLGRGSRLASDGDEDLLGVDQHLGTVIQSDLGLVLGQQTAPSVQIVDRVVCQILNKDAV